MVEVLENKMKKRFQKHKELITQAVKNVQSWTPQERLCQNVLVLNGVVNPSLKFVQQVIRQQQANEITKKYKELTNGKFRNKNIKTDS